LISELFSAENLTLIDFLFDPPQVEEAPKEDRKRRLRGKKAKPLRPQRKSYLTMRSLRPKRRFEQP
jgi:hypothetical protein